MTTAQSLISRILYEDNHIIVINKLPSEIVQGDKTGDMPLSDLVKAYIAKKYNKPGNVFLGVVHRIDRPVSGAVIFARTSKALARLNAMLQKRELQKKYWAVVKNAPPEQSGTLEHHLQKNEKQNKSYATGPDAPNTKKAELNYSLIAKSRDYYLLEVELITGRHHQVRAQLAEMGCPIKGDLKYGFDRSNADASIHLHARKLSFKHPVKDEIIDIFAPVPDDKLWKFFEEEVG
ncbi:MAG: RNA pseudouridine synthase [Bacteroidetes bacterium]|nr:MAG: RNA pseudouridine synthase [Bacteroidota bacterium]